LNDPIWTIFDPQAYADTEVGEATDTQREHSIENVYDLTQG
jgi:hypothetical protein